MVLDFEKKEILLKFFIRIILFEFELCYKMCVCNFIFIFVVNLYVCVL